MTVTATQLFVSNYVVIHDCSVVEDYAKWHLLIHVLSLYTAPLPDDNNEWKFFRNTKFPKTSKLSDDTKLTCVEHLQDVMPLAVSRPFVEEFVTNSMRAKVMATFYKHRGPICAAINTQSFVYI